MNDNELQQLVEKEAQTWFKAQFRHQARFNSRLRTTGGRYLLASHDIEINPKMLTEHNFKVLEGVIRHELCHYFLHLAGKGYQHRDRDFKNLLAQVHGSRYAPLSKSVLKGRLVYQCSRCGAQYIRVRRINTQRYVCSKCRGRLIFLKKIK